MSPPLHQKHEKGTLDDNDRAQRKADLAKEIRHTKAGIWEVHEQIPHTRFGFDVPWVEKVVRNLEILEDLPFYWRMVKDVVKFKSCRYYLSLFLLVKTLVSLQPAVRLWFTSYSLTLVQVAIDERRIDVELLLFSSLGRLCCAIASSVLDYWEKTLQVPLNLLMCEHFDEEVFIATVRLDVPTYDDKAVKARLQGMSKGPQGSRHGVVWGSLYIILGLFFSAARFLTELSLLAKVVASQQDGFFLAAVLIGKELLELLLTPDWSFSRAYAWSATTDNEHYHKVIGLDRLIRGSEHKQEVVAGNLAEHLLAEYKQAYDHISGKWAPYYDVMYNSQRSGLKPILSMFVPRSIAEASEASFLLASAARPETIATRFSTVRLIQTTLQGLAYELWMMSYKAKSIGDQLHKVRHIYETQKTQNKVVDGAVSFPEDRQSLRSGITVEFRNVSFRYPTKDDFALRNVSFKVEKGQLCVIVGTNGSGKSTILKLLLRLYDPIEGTILINGQDIKTLKLADLRESMAILFQDYTHFPITVGENIGLGDPQNAHDKARIREAARLGGAEEFIDKLNEGFNTYLDRPVPDVLSIPSNAKTRSGLTIDSDLFRETIGRVGNEDTVKLSGGQMQRLAVSRMFMRAVLSEEARVGLLSFDEPSAALDPAAEHDLFTRIQKLRGEKTMIFSSHRFGQLTKPADLILYMKDSNILESGTHSELMAKGGKYAELWNLQAQAFL